jgi:hypothetical protein
MWSGKLRVPESTYRDRLERCAKMIELEAPWCIIHMNSRLLTECFEYTWKDRWERWLFTKAPKWVAWVCDADYRQACKEYLVGDDDEDEDSSNS